MLSLARSTAYYRAQEVSEADLVLMRRIDALHLEHPFAGSRMLRDCGGTATQSAAVCAFVNDTLDSLVLEAAARDSSTIRSVLCSASHQGELYVSPWNTANTRVRAPRKA